MILSKVNDIGKPSQKRPYVTIQTKQTGEELNGDSNRRRVRTRKNM